MVLFFQEILRTAELYSPFTTTEEDVMNNELVGGLMSNVSVIYCYNQIFESEECSSQYIFKFIGKKKPEKNHSFESRWSPDFFQASSFQLLKLEDILR